MKKPESLKSILLEAVPDLAAAPDKLALFVDKGSVASRGTASLSFEYRYTLSLVVMDYAGDVDALMVPVLAWIAREQPDLLFRDGQEPFSFEVEILDGNTADVSIAIELTERVRVERTAGGLRTEHLSDVQSADEFAGVTGVSLLAGLAEDLADGTVQLVASSNR
ncbi:phage tail protein [Sphingomonas aracearum]|uniref:Phage tail protein n=1 Tax=Sphingomonas aracearum TaxID=2283317 RepID=A0A369VU21_9SPHN|nr:phage tail protein [Sphingomonas aracearum]RDE04690.1 phage tail protein [Sphingomonas aracearum]